MKKTQIVVPIMPQNSADIDQLDPKLYQDADIIEWRADFLPLDQILPSAPQIFEKFQAFKVLFTVRTAKEGGNLDISNKKYSQLLHDILAFNPNWIDLEYFAHRPAINVMSDFRDKLVLSYHNFERMPNDLTGRLIEMDHEKTAYVKAAIMPQRECEVLDLMQITRDMTLEYGPHFITMAMGDLGKISRISGYLTGSCWTFASLENASAPGQISLQDTKRILQILESHEFN